MQDCLNNKERITGVMPQDFARLCFSFLVTFVVNPVSPWPSKITTLSESWQKLLNNISTSCHSVCHPRADLD